MQGSTELVKTGATVSIVSPVASSNPSNAGSPRQTTAKLVDGGTQTGPESG